MKKKYNQSAIEFINAGISCNCLVLLKELNLLEFLSEGRAVGLKNLIDKNFCSNSKAAYSALITLEKSGIVTKLKGVWEDVTVAMQYFVFHDFIKNKSYAKSFNAYIKNFPNLKCFIYVDIVSASNRDQIMPGYDYVHGLLGIETPTYEETIELFNKSGFSIVNEQPVFDLPNTFIWVLSPKKSKFFN